MQSIGRSIDWILEDNMLDGLFKLDPGSSWESQPGEVGAGVGDENAEACG